MLSKQIPLGIYEKALPAGECWLACNWQKRWASILSRCR